MKIDWDAYQKGKEASIKYNSDTTKANNPYILNTDSWYSWNKGWNSDNKYPKSSKA